MKIHKTLILEGRLIRRVIGITDALKAVEFAFRYLGKGKIQMPAKIYLHLDKYKGDFRAMPAYIEGLEACGIKWVNVHPENRPKGLPSVMAIIILSDCRTGLPLCIMDGTYITALRTGASGGIAAKYLSRKNAHRIALVGCGAQARTQLIAIGRVRNIQQVNVCGLTEKEAAGFIKDMRYLKLKMRACKTIKECVRDCDIVVTATPSRHPIVKLEWLKPGAHINAIGADAKGKQELDPEILKNAKVVVDAWEQAAHSGEINVPLAKGQISRGDIYGNIGEVVIGAKGRRSEKEITVFDSTGLAIQDMALADIAYKKALKLKQGKYVSFLWCRKV